MKKPKHTSEHAKNKDFQPPVRLNGTEPERYPDRKQASPDRKSAPNA